MFTLRGSQVVMCDVDDTLVMWNWPQGGTERFIELNPWGELNSDGSIRASVKLAVNDAVIEQLIKHKLRGHKIVVWSQGGWEWAEQVVFALNLQDTVDLVVEKPSWIYDDLEAVNFMPKAKWVGNKEWLDG